MQRLVATVLACTLLILPASLLAAEKVALVIGNSKYQHISALDNPSKDVRLIAESLDKVGFDVTTLLDSDLDAMERAINNFARALDRSGRDTVGLFYFAGHGITYDGQNWLIPVDVKLNAGPEVKRKAISAQEVLNYMEEAKNATNIMILDACRDNPFEGLAFSNTRSVAQGMAPMQAPEGSFIAFSTAAGKVAYDGRGDHSPFADAFANEIVTPDIPINSMMINVNARVRRVTEGLGPVPQVPWVRHSLSQNFWFNKRAGGEPQDAGGVASLPESQPAPTRKKTREELEEIFWADVKDSGDPDEYAVFLKRFPDGMYSDLAKTRQAKYSQVRETTRGNDPAPPAQAVQMQSTADPEVADLCRELAGGDSLAYADCLSEMNDIEGTFVFEDGDGSIVPPDIRGMQDSQSIVWYDNEHNQWQVNLAGANFYASGFIQGSGPLQLQGQFVDTQMSFAIYDSLGQQVGYGYGAVTDATHISVTNYYLNGVVSGYTTFHINHAPQ